MKKIMLFLFVCFVFCGCGYGYSPDFQDGLYIDSLHKSLQQSVPSMDKLHVDSVLTKIGVLKNNYLGDDRIQYILNDLDGYISDCVVSCIRFGSFEATGFVMVSTGVVSIRLDSFESPYYESHFGGRTLHLGYVRSGLVQLVKTQTDISGLSSLTGYFFSQQESNQLIFSSNYFPLHFKLYYLSLYTPFDYHSNVGFQGTFDRLEIIK